MGRTRAEERDGRMLQHVQVVPAGVATLIPHRSCDVPSRPVCNCTYRRSRCGVQNERHHPEPDRTRPGWMMDGWMPVPALVASLTTRGGQTRARRRPSASIRFRLSFLFNIWPVPSLQSPSNLESPVVGVIVNKRPAWVVSGHLTLPDAVETGTRHGTWMARLRYLFPQAHSGARGL